MNEPNVLTEALKVEIERAKLALENRSRIGAPKVELQILRVDIERGVQALAGDSYTEQLDCYNTLVWRRLESDK